MKCAANPSVASEIIHKQVADRIKVVNQVMLACSAHILLDKFEFTPEKAAEFIAHTEYLYKSVCENYVSFEDIIKNLKAEYGIDLRFNFKGKAVSTWDVG